MSELTLDSARPTDVVRVLDSVERTPGVHKTHGSSPLTFSILTDDAQSAIAIAESTRRIPSVEPSSTRISSRSSYVCPEHSARPGDQIRPGVVRRHDDAHEQQLSTRGTRPRIATMRLPRRFTWGRHIAHLGWLADPWR